MNFTKAGIASLIITVFSNPATWILLAVIGVVIILSGVIGSCNVANWNKKATSANNNIQNSAVNAAVSEATANATEKQVNKLENIANAKETNANNAAANFNAISNRSAGYYSNNASDARANFCREYPGDPLCGNR
jgi:uncharacterized protein YneF (UPF0154 family)